MYTISESSIQEEERQRQLGKCMQKLKELEDECKGIAPVGSSNPGEPLTGVGDALCRRCGDRRIFLAPLRSLPSSSCALGICLDQ